MQQRFVFYSIILIDLKKSFKFRSAFSMITKVLDDVSSLVKQATDRKVFHIEDIILSMSELNLITLFDEPIDMNVLLDENEKHKKNIGIFQSVYIKKIYIV